MTMTQEAPTTRDTPARRPVRVCFMIDRLAPAGTESQLVALIRRLDRTRVQPFLCLLDGVGPASQALEPADCPVLRLGVERFVRPAALAAAWRLVRFLRRERIDVLQVYFPDSTFLGVPAAVLAGVPYVLRTRNNTGYSQTPSRRRVGRLLNRFVTLTIANCEACRRSLLADEGPAPGSVVVLENGVDLDRFPNPGAANPDGTRRVGAVANLRPEKRIDLLADAAARLVAGRPDVVFEVAGEGTCRAALEQQFAEHGLAGRFHLPGSLADVPAFLERLDVAVLCSDHEGMSNAVLEYMAAGRPVVATAVGATAELVQDGVTGLLVPPNDAAALARAIGTLLDDPARAVAMGAAGRRRVEERFSREAMVRRMTAFYERLVGEGVRAVAPLAQAG
jgi:glycosyltransferase involved in cell wall biosynthesis